MGKNESKPPLLSKCLDLFKANGVIKVERIKYINRINIETTKKIKLVLIF